MDQSKKYTLNSPDLKSIGWIFLFGLISVGVTQLLELIPQINFGDHSEIVSAALILLLKAVQRWIQGR